MGEIEEILFLSMRSALAGAASTVVVLAALGSPAAVEAARDEGSLLATSVTGFATWDVADAPGDVVGLVVLRLAVTVVVAGLLAGLAGRSRSRPAAWLGGWAAVVVAAAVGAVAGYVYQVAIVLDGQTFAATWADGLVGSANTGAAFGLWTGWLVGVLVAVATRPAAISDREVGVRALGFRTTDRPDLGAADAGRRISDPPPPWWAPTTGAADAHVHPGPTAFPPGGFGPVVPGVGEPVPPLPAPHGGASHEMTTVSGDPHPSDPDATQAVGLPPDATVAEAVAGARGPAGGPDAAPPAADHDDDHPVAPDAAAAIEPPAPDDHTADVRRPEG